MSVTPLQTRVQASRKGARSRKLMREMRRVPWVSEYAILGLLSTVDGPLTTLEVAAALQANARSMSSRLSRLADYGKIGREHISTHVAGDVGVTSMYCLWRSLAVPLPSGEAPERSGLGLDTSQPGASFLQRQGAGAGELQEL